MALADKIRRPQLGNLEAGLIPDITTDALGRRMVKSNETRKNFGDFKPSKRGGMPDQKGIESFIPRALEAAQRLNIPSNRVTRRPVLERLFANRVGKGSPGPLRETLQRLSQLKRTGGL